jgi:hypothetical protein
VNSGRGVRAATSQGDPRTMRRTAGSRTLKLLLAASALAFGVALTQSSVGTVAAGEYPSDVSTANQPKWDVLATPTLAPRPADPPLPPRPPCKSPFVC